MTSSTEFVIYLEDPGVDIKVCSNQFCKLVVKIFGTVNIVGTNWNRDVSLVENTFGT